MNTSDRSLCELPPRPEPAGGVLSAAVVPLRLAPDDAVCRPLNLARFPEVAERLRRAILAHSDGASAAARSVLSGHTPSGGVLEGAHLAFLPLLAVRDGVFVSDAGIAGMAVALPARLPVTVRHEVIRRLARVRVLFLGALGRWRVALQERSDPAWLDGAPLWIGPAAGAAEWATVTPYVFDRHPKGRSGAHEWRNAAACVRASCVAAGHPEPVEVRLAGHAFLSGVPPAAAFQPMRRKDGSARRHVHVRLRFSEPVRGPILIGAGRYRGWGALSQCPSWL